MFYQFPLMQKYKDATSRSTDDPSSIITEKIVWERTLLDGLSNRIQINKQTIKPNGQTEILATN